MKKVAALALSTVAVLSASEFSGKVGFASTAIFTEDKMAVNDKNDVVSQTGSATETKYYKAFPTFSLQYDAAVIKTVGQNIMAGFKGEQLQVYGVYALAPKAWKDPYVFDTPREEVDATAFGAKVIYEPIKLIKFSYEAVFESVDDAPAQKDLEQSGMHNRAEVELTLPVFDGFLLKPLAFGAIVDKDGEANSHTNAGFGLGAVAIAKPFTLFAQFKSAQSEYDKVNPVFSKTRDDETKTYLVSLTVDDALGFADTYVKLNYIYSKLESNINFYDSKKNVAIVEFGVKF